jgi:hypothetical protein
MKPSAKDIYIHIYVYIYIYTFYVRVSLILDFSPPHPRDLKEEISMVKIKLRSERMKAQRFFSSTALERHLLIIETICT